MRLSSARRPLTTAILASVSSIASAWGDQHTSGVPQLASRPGASYTLYLDPAGFNWTGGWGNTEHPNPPPGNCLGLNNLGPAATFSAYDQTEIRSIWATVAQAFRSFNVNVTTVDPAIAAGQSSTDVARQAYYESQMKMMHTIISGGDSTWTGGGNKLLGISHEAVFQAPYVGSPDLGDHTNWLFTSLRPHTNAVADGQSIGRDAAHEDGHAFGLGHQSDVAVDLGVLYHTYGYGDAVSANDSYVPIMGGGPLAHPRAAWRSGLSSPTQGSSTPQNDVATMFSYNTYPSLGMDFGYVDSGIGHTFASATPLPLVGNSVNAALAGGVISPHGTGPSFDPNVTVTDIANPSGASSYTKDLFSFASDGITPISLTAHDGTDLLTPGTADPGITLRSVLRIYDSSFALVGTAIEDPSTLFESYNGLLPAGTYYAEIASFGGHAEVNPGFQPATYYDMGGYFLTGSGFVAVPEPAAMSLLSLSASVGLLRRRSR